MNRQVPGREYLVREYVENKKSIPDIATEFNCGRSKIRWWLIRYGIALRTNTEGVRLASSKISKAQLGKRKHNWSDESRKKLSESLLKVKAEKRKGFSLKPSGYYECTFGENINRPIHRILVEDQLGRKLETEEHVHHINHVKSDNRLENLVVLSRSEHMRLHALERIANGTNYDISQHSKSGELHPMASLKETDVLFIRNELAGVKSKIIAEMYGVSVSCIKHIKKFRTWKNLKSENYDKQSIRSGFFG